MSEGLFSQAHWFMPDPPRLIDWLDQLGARSLTTWAICLLVILISLGNSCYFPSRSNAELESFGLQDFNTVLPCRWATILPLTVFFTIDSNYYLGLTYYQFELW